MAVRMLAAIDASSFELRLSICEMSYKTGIQHIGHIRHVIALGRDTYSTDKIGYGPVEEMCQVLEESVQIMKSYKVRDYRAYATSATKGAHNRQIILDQIRVRIGLTARTINNPEQRFISYRIIAAKVAEFNRIIQKGTVTMDVGFGSAQLSLFDKSFLAITQDLPLGILRVRGLLVRIPTTMEKHKQHIEEIMGNELLVLRKMYLKDREITSLIGIEENILYIINRPDLNTYGDKVDTATMNHFYECMCQMTTDQIEERFGVNSEYASLLLPNVVVHKRILELTGAEMFWMSDTRLRGGIVAEYANKNKPVRFSYNFGNDVLAASRNIAKRYGCHTSHSQVLEQYALGIFDNMKKSHGLGQRERLMLQIAALFHACGKFASIRNSNECSYSIITSTEIISLSHLERETITNMVWCNICDFDYDKVQLGTQVHQEEDAGVSRNAIIILIARLTAILRLADSMDHSYRGELVDCCMAIREDELAITTDHLGNTALEAASFKQKADFFEEIFDIKPILR